MAAMQGGTSDLDHLFPADAGELPLLQDPSTASTCIPRDISLTSSRNRLPPSAWRNFPYLARSAPVKDPLSWPNSSDSSRVFGDPPRS